tara:strand:- start:467 stop:1465 length:999 start_codon:yes stop_codon:yes gene_type:complete
MNEITSTEYFDSFEENENELMLLLTSGARFNKDHLKGSLTIITEGKLDHKIFTKISEGSEMVLYVRSIAGLFDIYEVDDNDRKGVNNRNLVRKFCKFMNKELGCLAIGIQDMDYEGIRDLLNSKYENKSTPKNNLFSTKNSTAIETLVLPRLYNHKKRHWIFSEYESTLTLSKNLGIVRYGIERLKNSGIKSLKQKHMNELQPSYHDYKNRLDEFDVAKNSYFELCKSENKIIEKLVEDNNLDHQTEMKLRSSVDEVKSLLIKDLGDLDSIYDFYIEGHDFEYILRGKIKMGISKFRDVTSNLVSYEYLKQHLMFQSIDEWRKKNKLPNLFS